MLSLNDGANFSFSFSSRTTSGVTEVDSSVKVPRSRPIPAVIISADGDDQEPKENGEHDRDSDTGSTYDGSIYGVDSHYGGSDDDLTSRGHVELHLK